MPGGRFTLAPGGHARWLDDAVRDFIVDAYSAWPGSAS